MSIRRLLGLAVCLFLGVAGPQVADAYRSQSATPLPIQADLDGDGQADSLGCRRRRASGSFPLRLS